MREDKQRRKGSEGKEKGVQERREEWDKRRKIMRREQRKERRKRNGKTWEYGRKWRLRKKMKKKKERMEKQGEGGLRETGVEREARKVGRGEGKEGGGNEEES